jgi:hypothetical protein
MPLYWLAEGKGRIWDRGTGKYCRSSSDCLSSGLSISCYVQLTILWDSHETNILKVIYEVHGSPEFE